MLAKSALHDRPAQNSANAKSEPTPGMRVILPASAEPAAQVTAAAPGPQPQPEAQPGNEAQAPVAKKSAENVEVKDRDERMERRKRYAERKAKRIATAKVRQGTELQERQEPGIMAFGRDEPRISLFGN